MLYCTSFKRIHTEETIFISSSNFNHWKHEWTVVSLTKYSIILNLLILLFLPYNKVGKRHFCTALDENLVEFIATWTFDCDVKLIFNVNG